MAKDTLYVVIEVVGEKVEISTNIDLYGTDVQFLVKHGDEIPLNATDHILQGGERFKKTVGDYVGDRIYQSCRSVNCLANAQHWRDETDKFVFCLDRLDMSLSEDGDEVCEGAVSLLETMFEKTLKEHGVWDSA